MRCDVVRCEEAGITTMQKNKGTIRWGFCWRDGEGAAAAAAAAGSSPVEQPLQLRSSSRQGPADLTAYHIRFTRNSANFSGWVPATDPYRPQHTGADRS